MATLDDYKKFIDEVCKLTDLPAMASDDNGLVCHSSAIFDIICLY